MLRTELIFMKYPQLVPDKVCHTSVMVYADDGLNRDGSPKRDIIFEGKCYYEEKTKQVLSADKTLITLSGAVFFNGDIAPEKDVIHGKVEIIGNSKITRNIYSSMKAKNPDGTVNYTKLELI